jgi:hypothetical protein
VWGTVRDALLLVRDNPRAAMLPMAVIHVPAAFISALVTVFVYFTVFGDRDFLPSDELIAAGASGPLFLFLALAAFEGLFAQVARGATICSIAGVVSSKRRTLTEALDPAFTRMGGLIVLAVLFAVGAVVLAVSFIGIVLIPILGLRLALAFEAYILEGLTPGAALRRSWGLMGPIPGRPVSFIGQVFSGTMLRLLGILIVVGLLAAVPLIVISSVLPELVTGGRDGRVVTSGFVTIVQAVLLTPIIACITATTTLFYLRLRELREGKGAAGN